MKKNIPIIIIALVLFSALVFFATQFFFPRIPAIEQKLWLNANEINKTCPARVDDATRLDNVTVFPNNVFQYNYTLYNLLRTDVNPDIVIKTLEPKIIASVKKDPELKFYKDAKTTLVYSYRDRNGEFIFKIMLGPEKYK